MWGRCEAWVGRRCAVCLHPKAGGSCDRALCKNFLSQDVALLDNTTKPLCKLLVGGRSEATQTSTTLNTPLIV